MENHEIIITDSRMAETVKGSLGVDLNYQPFSSWYGSVLEKMETSNEITDSIFFQALEHIGAISRRGTAIIPPEAIYEQMKGKDGDPQVSWYCKKFSNVQKEYVESYGICLTQLEKFEDHYLQPMLNILNFIESEVAIERELAEDWRRNAKAKFGRDKHRRISAQARSMVKEARDFIVREAFKKGKEDE